MKTNNLMEYASAVTIEKQARYKLHVLSHTHWDREWYQDFQGFRQRLVFQMDALLDLLKRQPDYRSFLLDGQTSCLIDYLDIMPEKREALSMQIRAGRIVIGPWFVMPDTLLLSGESLVKNLQLGHRICREFGVEPMRVGYVTDIFGHCSQFPQILSGFGIDTALLHRGTACEEDEKTEMLWVGADGTEVLIVRVSPDGGYHEDFPEKLDVSNEDLQEYVRKKQAMSVTGVMFALDGGDHHPAKADTLAKIKRINEMINNTVCVHSSIDDFLDELRSRFDAAATAGLKRYYGELRHPCKRGNSNYVFNGTASSRINLKQENDKIEYLLARNAEQMNVWSCLCGGNDQRRFLDLAWRYLLLNHPHDSIVGCSMDQVHRDMLYRFDQARMLAQNSVWESIQSIDDVLNTAAVGAGGRVVTVHNQSAVDIGPVIRFTFDVFEDEVKEQHKKGVIPALFDEAGSPVKFCVVQVESGKWREPFVRKTKGETWHYHWAKDMLKERKRYHVIAAASVPAFGFKTWRIGFLPKREFDVLTLPETLEKSLAGKGIIENEYIILKANADSSVDLFDKPSGRWYRGIHQIEDCGDKGQGWDHFYPANDVVVRSTDPASISKLRITTHSVDGLTASLTISYNIRIPAGLAPGRESRSKKMVTNKVRTIFTLDAGVRRVDCLTEIDNMAECHRMRAIFPTNIQCSTWLGDTAFDIVERNIKLRDTTGWLEQAREESPIKNFAAASDDDGAGFAVITKGLCEACIQDNPSRSLALTLFRSFSENLYGCWTQESQMKGKLMLEYSLVPFTCSPHQRPVSLLHEAERLKIKVYALTEDSKEGTIAPTGQFIKIAGSIVVSTIKTSEDGKGLVMRLYNPDAITRQFSVELICPVRSVWLCDSNEQKIRMISENTRSFALDAAAKKIISLYIETLPNSTAAKRT